MAFAEITSAHRYEYNENVQLAVQQKVSRLEMTCTYQPNLKGKLAQAIELIGATEAIEGGGRGEDTPHIEPRTEPVFIQPVAREWGRILEKEDEIKRVISYQSVYVQEGAAAMVRAKDRVIANAIFGQRRVGQDGTTFENFTNPNGNVAVNYVKTGGVVTSGLTVPKVIRAYSLLSLTEQVEDDEVFMAVTNIQMEDLFNSLQFSSKDYRDKAVFDDKERTVLSFFGVKFIRLQPNYLPVATSVRSCPMWMKSGLHFAEFMPLETNLERNPQKKYRLHPFMEMYIGSTRSEDAKVVEVLCSEV